MGFLVDAVADRDARRFVAGVKKSFLDVPVLRRGNDFGSFRGVDVMPKVGAVPDELNRAFEDFRLGIPDYEGLTYHTSGLSAFTVWASSDLAAQTASLLFDISLRNYDIGGAEPLRITGRRLGSLQGSAGIEVTYRNCPSIIDESGRLRPVHTLNSVGWQDRRRTADFALGMQSLVQGCIDRHVPAQVLAQEGDWPPSRLSIFPVPHMVPFINRAA